jgi:hypothetical protein
LALTSGEGGMDLGNCCLNPSSPGIAGREKGGSSRGVDGPRDSAEDRAPCGKEESSVVFPELAGDM